MKIKLLGFVKNESYFFTEPYLKMLITRMK